MRLRAYKNLLANLQSMLNVRCGVQGANLTSKVLAGALMADADYSGSNLQVWCGDVSTIAAQCAPLQDLRNVWRVLLRDAGGCADQGVRGGHEF
jgi:hypothetical protein